MLRPAGADPDATAPAREPLPPAHGDGRRTTLKTRSDLISAHIAQKPGRTWFSEKRKGRRASLPGGHRASQS